MVRRTYQNGGKNEGCDSSMDDDYFQSHPQPKRDRPGRGHPGEIVPMPDGPQQQHGHHQYQHPQHPQHQPSNKPYSAGIDGSGRGASGWDPQRVASADCSSIREDLNHDKPQRPWFYSGSPKTTAAVVRKEIAARRSGSGTTSELGVENPPYEGRSRVDGNGGGGGGGGGGGDGDGEGAGGGGRNRGSDAECGSAAGHGACYAKTRDSWNGDGVAGRGYHSGEHSALSKYTSCDNPCSSAVVWAENPQVAHVLNHDRQAQAPKVWSNNSDRDNKQRQQQDQQQQPYSRREPRFRYPPIDDEDENYNAPRMLSSTVFPYAMVRRSSFLRSALRSGLDSRFRAPPPPVPSHMPVPINEQVAATGKEAATHAPMHAHAHAHTHPATTAAAVAVDAAAAAPGWRPVWADHHHNHHYYDRHHGGFSRHAEEERGWHSGGRAPQEWGVRFREREHEDRLEKGMEAHAEVMERERSAAFSGSRSAAAATVNVMPGPVVRRGYYPPSDFADADRYRPSSDSADADRYRPPSVPTPPPPASTVPHENDEYRDDRMYGGREVKRGRVEIRDGCWSAPSPSSYHGNVEREGNEILERGTDKTLRNTGLGSRVGFQSERDAASGGVGSAGPTATAAAAHSGKNIGIKSPARSCFLGST